ncbi:MAG: SH3 domain-containing protein [Chloroflexi bacterium]|nr:SH3 domain-containing protein [Chloroflexota bacterium]NOG61984.1 SH3 domain-containing protein [Chloroflexota bacterium]
MNRPFLPIFLLMLLAVTFLPLPIHPVMAQTPTSVCADGKPSQLVVGMEAIVAETVPAPLNLRQAPTPNSIILQVMPAGTGMTVIGGPECDSGYTFYQVELDNGLQGWAAESLGSFEGYFLIPKAESRQTETPSLSQDPVEIPVGMTYFALGIAACADGKPTFMQINGRAIVSQNVPAPLNVRTRPVDGEIITTLPAGTEIGILDGPLCGGGHTWYEVLLPDATIGWASESLGTESYYFLEPHGARVGKKICEDSQPSFLRVGEQVMIREDLPQPTVNLRESPPEGAVILGLPLGQKMTIIGGPECGNTNTWWQVQLEDGTTGWMSEVFGQRKEYYLDYMRATASFGESCTGQLPNVFRPGDRVTVTQQALSLTFQSEPNSTSAPAGDNFGPGQLFTIGVGDAVCDYENYATWIPVVSDDAKSGWVMQSRQLSKVDASLADAYFILSAGAFGENGRLICADAKPSRLSWGDVAIVEVGVRFRQAHPNGTVIYEVPRLTMITIVGGPLCGGGHTWWEVRLPDERIGWMSEGWEGENFYYLAPVR